MENRGEREFVLANSQRTKSSLLQIACHHRILNFIFTEDFFKGRYKNCILIRYRSVIHFRAQCPSCVRAFILALTRLGIEVTNFPIMMYFFRLLMHSSYKGKTLFISREKKERDIIDVSFSVGQGDDGECENCSEPHSQISAPSFPTFPRKERKIFIINSCVIAISPFMSISIQRHRKREKCVQIYIQAWPKEEEKILVFFARILFS